MARGERGPNKHHHRDNDLDPQGGGGGKNGGGGDKKGNQKAEAMPGYIHNDKPNPPDSKDKSDN